MFMTEDGRGDLDDQRTARDSSQEEDHRVRGENREYPQVLSILRGREIDVLPVEKPVSRGYLQRYHDIRTSDATVYRVCKRHGLNRLPNRVGRRAVHTHRYEKRVPGHHVQVDVKFLTLKRKKGGPMRRYQYTAIDDATRVRALKVYRRHTQANPIDFINYVVDKFPFRIRTIRTDRGHEFQALFHWHVADLGMEHVYIKPRTPQLNGKVERSHRTDKDEFYQLLTYRDDVDLEKKLAEWEHFYNYDRPHGAHRGKTPYEALWEKLR